MQPTLTPGLLPMSTLSPLPLKSSHMCNTMTLDQDDTTLDFIRDLTHSRLYISRELHECLEDRRQAERLARKADSDPVKGDDEVMALPVPVAEAAPIASRTPRRKTQRRALFDEAVVRAALEAAKKSRASVERSALTRKLLEQLIESGPLRDLARSDPGFNAKLVRLESQFPNANELTSFLRCHEALTRRSKKPATLPPLLLLGPPGVGKSVIVEALADAVGAPFYRLQCETNTHASVLTGTEPHWSSAGPGLLFDALVQGPAINPILMLDELEKAPGRAEHPSIHKVLYALLEPASARNFSDLSLPQVKLDASHIRWIATANSLAGIPEPILSRLTVIRIPPLGAAASRQVAQNIELTLRREFRLSDLPRFGPEVIDVVARHSPRVMRLRLKSLLGSMLSGGRTTPDEADIKRLALNTPASDPREGTSPLTDLLSITNLAALRAISIHAALNSAQATPRQSTDLLH